MQDLLSKVQTVNADVIFPPFASDADSPGLKNSSWFTALSGCLQGDITFGIAVKHSKKVVIRTCHYHTIERRKKRENRDSETAACGNSTDMTGWGELSFNLKIRHLLVSAGKEYKTGFSPALPRLSSPPLLFNEDHSSPKNPILTHAQMSGPRHHESDFTKQ